MGVASGHAECDTVPRLGEVWVQWLVKYERGRAIYNPSTSLGGCSSSIECLVKKQLWVHNAYFVTPEVGQNKEETRVPKGF